MKEKCPKKVARLKLGRVAGNLKLKYLIFLKSNNPLKTKLGLGLKSRIQFGPEPTSCLFGAHDLI